MLGPRTVRVLRGSAMRWFGGAGRWGYPHGAAIIVCRIWAAMAASVLAYLGRYAFNVPWQDDFDIVPTLAGQDPHACFLEWLWSPYNEHRPIVSRSVLVALFRMTHDFRAALFFNGSLLAAAAAAMIVLARRLRGHTSVTDAVLPIAMLHLGQWELLLVGFAMNLLLPTLAAYGLLWVSTTSGDRPSCGRIMRVGVCLLLLPLCGGTGVILAPAVAVWLGLWTVRGWRCGDGVSRGKLALALALILVGSALVAEAVYYIRWYKLVVPTPAQSLATAASTTLQYL